MENEIFFVEGKMRKISVVYPTFRHLTCLEKKKIIQEKTRTKKLKVKILNDNVANF